MAEAEWTAWIGRTETVADRFTANPVAALAASFDKPVTLAPGDPIPAMWSWLYFLPIVPMSGIGPDGHPKRGGFLPPIDLERRMWAGSRIVFHDRLRIGEAIEKTSEIRDVVEKGGRSGRKVFVSVRHHVRTERGLAMEEDQDIVYLPMPEVFTPPPPQALPADLTWSVPQPVDEVLLFRYSALTFNGHRIHYDRPYAKEVEKYPGLIVHGPLQAMLLVSAALERNPGRVMAAYRFRAVSPLFDFDTVALHGKTRDDGGLDLFTSNTDGHVAMQASIDWV